MRKARVVLSLAVLILFSVVSSSIAETPGRIISLAPNLTEILFEMGLGSRIVGVTQFCDYPAEAKKKPKVGGMSNPSPEAVVTLKPDLVLMTTDGNPKEFGERFRKLGVKTYLFRAQRLSELPHEIRKLGMALDAKREADALAGRIENTLKKLRDRKIAKPQKVLFIVWPEPLIVAGPDTAIDDSIKLFGHTNIAAGTGISYPKYSLEEIIRQSPDAIFIGMGHAEIKEISQGLLRKLGNVPAVRNHRVFFLSDNLYRLGPRIIKGIQEMAECLK
ncbi:MAG TPA: cobalamin-binding protein [Thermodesulfovibrionales bacterium]|nr:cobalamin-binding protein [Thermodesulfovibrionales bacterium]